MTENSWHEVLSADQVERGDVVEVRVDGCQLAIVRTQEDAYFAIDALCTHGRANLAEGFVDGDEIECPKHNGRFNVATGEAVAHPAKVSVRTHPCQVRDGRVEVQL